MKTNSDSSVFSCIMHAIQSRDLQNVKEQLEHLSNRAQPVDSELSTINNLKLPKSGDSLLHVAARTTNGSEILRYLIETEHGNVELTNADGKTPLHEAAQFNQLESVKILLDHGANVNTLKRADWTPLMLACAKPDTLHIIKLFLEHNADVLFTNKDGWNCFHIACREGNLDIIKHLVSHATSKFPQSDATKFLFSKSRNGRSPLHTAVMHGNLDVCHLLLTLAKQLEHGSIVNEPDKCGSTPIMEACRFGHTEILELIYEHGGIVKPEVVNGNGMNCLHIAAEAGKTKILEKLLSAYNFEMNMSNQQNGLAALHYAVRENQVDVISFLLRRGADFTRADNKGWTPLDMSKELKKTEAFEILMSFQEEGAVSSSS